MTSRSTIPLALFVIGVAAVAGGCGRDNGLPGDLTEHLAGHGISLDVLGSQAPLSSRAGLLFFEENPSIEQRIIAELDLESVEPGSEEFESVSTRVVAKPRALWGASGRPAKLKLADGGQFEYLYLLKTEDGRTYLLAEYAYG